jgi:membrane protein
LDTPPGRPRRDGARALAWARAVLARLEGARTLGLAAETAFWLLLSLVPLAAVLGLVAARISVSNWADAAPILSALPPAARKLVAEELVHLDAWNEGAVGPWSALVFVWLASSGVHSIFDSLELQAGATRPWWRKRALSLLACVALSIVAAALALLGPLVTVVVEWFGSSFPVIRGIDGPSLATRALRWAVSAGLVFGLNCGLFWVGIPRGSGPRMPIAPGAALAVALQIALGIAHGAYLASVGDGGAYVAGLAVIGVTMIGLYLFVAALLCGGVLNRWLGDPPEVVLSDAH